MGKLRPLSARQVLHILEDHGFSQIRQRGSHIAMQGATTAGTTITVIVPNHKQIRIGTLQSIIRQSQLPRELFEAA